MSRSRRTQRVWGGSERGSGNELKTTTVPSFCLVEAEIEEVDDEVFGRR